jgi:hypothetical protein
MCRIINTTSNLETFRAGCNLPFKAAGPMNLEAKIEERSVMLANSESESLSSASDESEKLEVLLVEQSD